MHNGTSIHVDDALMHQIEALADAGGMTTVELIRAALEEYTATHGAGVVPHPNTLGTAPDKPLGVRLNDLLDAVLADVPSAELDALPRDLARNFDHYHYGHPRED